MKGEEKNIAKAFAFFVFLVGVGFAVTLATQKPATQQAEATDEMPVATPTVISPKIRVSERNSAKADKKLTLREVVGADSVVYTLTVSDISGANEKTLYTKTLPLGSSIVLPFNSWDPTDTYVFVEERIAGTKNYTVLKASGESFADGSATVNVGAVWSEKEVGYTIREATGWASGTLLIIYTSKDDGAKGPAFWFEIPSTAIIQLAG